MSWNYRIIYHDLESESNYFAVHEVYYSKDGGVISWTVEPIDFIADDPLELISCLEEALNDVESLSVLNESSLAQGRHRGKNA